MKHYRLQLWCEFGIKIPHFTSATDAPHPRHQKMIAALREIVLEDFDRLGRDRSVRVVELIPRPDGTVIDGMHLEKPIA